MYREPSDETKKKISLALRGRRKSLAHIQAISKAMKKYWENIPKKTKEDKTKEEG